MDKKKDRIWIVPRNDAEALEIINILDVNNENYVCTGQKWGASWSGLEEDILIHIKKECENCRIIYGVELCGPFPKFGKCQYKNIDHHRYGDEDRYNSESSIEQTARILNIQLTRFQKLISINDVDWIPGLIRAGATDEEIKAVRTMDRKAQGITERDELQAEIDINKAEWLNEHKCLLYCPGGQTSAHTDRLFGKYKELLSIGPNRNDPSQNEINYYGPVGKIETLNKMRFPYKHWSGGGKTDGFFGIITDEKKIVDRIISFFKKD